MAADAEVRLILDPAGMVAGARAATAALGTIRTAAARLPQAAAPATTRFATQIGAAGGRAGDAFGRTLSAGIRRSSGTVTTALHGTLRNVDRLLPHSNAATGPLRDLTRSGAAIPTTLASGVRRATPALLAAIDSAARQAQARLSSIRPSPIRMPTVQGGHYDAGGRLLDAGGRFMARGAGAWIGDHRRRVGTATAHPAAGPAPVPQPGVAGAPPTMGAWLGNYRARTGQAAPTGFARQPAAAPPAAPPPARPTTTRGGARGIDDDFHMARGIRGIWAMGAIGGSVRRSIDGLGRFNDTVTEVGRELQDTRSELRAVLTDEHSLPGMTRDETIEALYGRARAMATGRTRIGADVGVTETQYTETLRGLAASGFKGAAMVSAADIAAPFSIASELHDPKAAANYLAIGATMWLDRAAISAAAPEDRMRVAAEQQMRLADMMTKAQDTYRTPEGFRPIGEAMVRFAPQAHRVDPEQGFALMGSLIDAGRTGPNAGFAAMRIVRDLDQAFERANWTLPTTESGNIDVVRALGMMRTADLSNPQINRMFGRRTGAPVQQLVNLDADLWAKFVKNIEGFEGTMLENVREHLPNLTQRERIREARRQSRQADIAEGTMDVRRWWADTMTNLEEAIAPGGDTSRLWRDVGQASQVLSAVGRPVAGALDMGLGLYAADQLFGGRIQKRFEAGVDRRRELREQRRTTRAQAQGIRNVRRGWDGVFRSVNTGFQVGTVRTKGFFNAVSAGFDTLDARLPGTFYGAPGGPGGGRPGAAPHRMTQPARFGVGRPGAMEATVFAAVAASSWIMAGKTMELIQSGNLEKAWDEFNSGWRGPLAKLFGRGGDQSAGGTGGTGDTGGGAGGASNGTWQGARPPTIAEAAGYEGGEILITGGAPATWQGARPPTIAEAAGYEGGEILITGGAPAPGSSAGTRPAAAPAPAPATVATAATAPTTTTAAVQPGAQAPFPVTIAAPAPVTVGPAPAPETVATPADDPAAPAADRPGLIRRGVAWWGRQFGAADAVPEAPPHWPVGEPGGAPAPGIAPIVDDGWAADLARAIRDLTDTEKQVLGATLKMLNDQRSDRRRSAWSAPEPTRHGQTAPGELEDFGVASDVLGAVTDL